MCICLVVYMLLEFHWGKIYWFSIVIKHLVWPATISVYTFQCNCQASARNDYTCLGWILWGDLLKFWYLPGRVLQCFLVPTCLLTAHPLPDQASWYYFLPNLSICTCAGVGISSAPAGVLPRGRRSRSYLSQTDSQDLGNQVSKSAILPLYVLNNRSGMYKRNYQFSLCYNTL